jgi:capsular exopolysaccharide synthesis family protein
MTLETRLDALKSQLIEKEVRLAEAFLADLATELSASEQQEQRIRAELDQQQHLAMSMSADASEDRKAVAEVDRLQKQSDALASRILEISVNSAKPVPLNVRVLDPATVDTDPVKPHKTLILLGALFVGGLIGLSLATLREMRDTRIHGADEIIPLLGVPVITMVPHMNRRLPPAKRGQIVRLDPRCAVAEAYRRLRTSLNLGAHVRPKIILVASAESGEGKSTTASNLAIVFAEAGERTLLIDCDLREPVQHVIFDQPATTGISTVLAGEARLDDVVRPTTIPQLYILPCGPIPPHPAEQLASKRFTVLLQQLSGAFDRIIIDSPPVTSVTDAQILAASADATLIVLRVKRSMRHMVAYTLDALQRVGAHVAGVVANEVVQGSAYRNYYGQAWQYSRPSTDAIVVHEDRSLPRHQPLELIDDAASTAAFVEEQEPAWKGDDK